MKNKLHQGGGYLILTWCILLNTAQAQHIDWVELNAAFKGSTFVNDMEICAACHEETIEKYHKTIHSRAFEYGSQEAGESADCETCHGPRSKHLEMPDASLGLSDSQYEKVCLQCHEGGDRMYWKNSLHSASEVSCVSCHAVMEKRSPEAQLAKSDEWTVCASCHADVRSEMLKSSHHPVREGLMNCSSCHNPHGTPGRGMLTMANLNETCYSCHQDKRGPFLWEHPPVREDCSNCHQPHGSNNRNLLTTMNATQCTTCHQYGGHVNQYRYNRVSTPTGNGCTNCHMTMHGSNHPSGTNFTR